jgi:hypothetical protein
MYDTYMIYLISTKTEIKKEKYLYLQLSCFIVQALAMHCEHRRLKIYIYVAVKTEHLLLLTHSLPKSI